MRVIGMPCIDANEAALRSRTGCWSMIGKHVREHKNHGRQKHHDGRRAVRVTGLHIPQNSSNISQGHKQQEQCSRSVITM